MKKGYVDISPSSSMLESQRHSNLGWKKALAELCDNSFDADASKVVMRFGSILMDSERVLKLTVRDDGVGCGDLPSMLKMGKHVSHKTTRLGRFGVGLKDAAAWMWGNLKIVSVSNGVRRAMTIDWQTLSDEDEWSVKEPKESPDEAGRGTHLTFTDISSPFTDYSKLARELGYTFAPALWEGREIKIYTPKKIVINCEGWCLPAMTDVVTAEFKVNGKGVKLKAGIVAEGERNPRQGFSYVHGHRIIKNTSSGAGLTDTSRICGLVELDGSWGLSRNKSDIVDKDQKPLEDAVYEKCEGIFSKAEDQATYLYSTELEDSLSESLMSILGAAKTKKEKRERKGKDKGGVTPKGTGRKRNECKNKQPGDTLTDMTGEGSLRVQWVDGVDDEIGLVDCAGGKTGIAVRLNKDHPFLASCRERRDKTPILVVCVSLLAHAVTDDDQREILKGMKNYENFPDALSKFAMTARMPEEARGSVSLSDE